MKNLYSICTVPGTCTQENSALNSTTKFSLALPNSISKRGSAHTLASFLCLLCFLLSFFFVGTSAIGQTPDTTDLFTHPHAMRTISYSGDTLRLQFELGSAQEDVANVMGYSVKLAFPKWAGTPDTVLLELNSSWVGNETEGPHSYSYDATEKELTFSFDRDSLSKTGAGFTAEVNFVAPNMTAEDRAFVVSGGIITIEDMMFKKEQKSDLTTLHPEINAFPNPVRTQLHFSNLQGLEGTLALLDLSGKQCLYQAGLLPEHIDVDGFKSGIYFVQIKTPDRVWTQKIVIE